MANHGLYGLIFDVDGVIADTEAVNATASIEMFAEMFGTHGVRRADFEMGLGRGAHAYVLAAARIWGLELTDEQLDAATRVRQEKFLKILRQQPLPAFPGVLELMSAAMTDDAFRVAIATSSTREKSQAVLKSAQVPYEKMAYITGSDVENRKPHPELFQKAAAMLNIAPQRCVVIEDAPDGVQAAHAAGCKCIAVTNSATAEKLSSADLVVTDISEITTDTLTQIITNIY